MAERTEVLRGRARPPHPTGLRRVRLVDHLLRIPRPRLVVVAAPAGCGKTTVLGHVAEAAGGRLAWLTLDRDIGSARAFLAHLQVSFAAVPGVTSDAWESAGDAVNALEAQLPTGSVLVLDELHTMAGMPALDVLRLLMQHLPAQLMLIVGGRSMPELELTRYRLTSSVVDIGAEELRFRTWEVEELFRSCYDVRLGSAEVGQLAQRTAGWAAGLQLFHLATAGRSPSARATLLAGHGGRLTGRYLAEQVLQQLPADMRDFVLRTSVLDALTPDRCDDLLRTVRSAAALDQLDRAGLLSSQAVSTGGQLQEYRYHEVLQTHLLDQLDARLGSAAARDLHRRAAELWRRESAHAAAVRSYCRAQDWEKVRAVIQVGGHDLADDRGSWVDLLPTTMQHTDPWVALALARRLLSDGALEGAAAAYARALTNFGGLSGTDTAARELRALRNWIDPPLGTVDDPLHQLRLALSDPRQVTVPTDASPIRWCAYAVALLVAGRLDEASTAFATAVQQPGASRAVEALSALGHATLMTLTGHPAAATARHQSTVAAAAAELPVLERLGDGLVRLFGARGSRAGTSPIADLIAACQTVEDRWGAALLGIFSTMRGLATGRTTPAAARRTTELLAALPAPALATWGAAAEALVAARSGARWEPDALARLERAAAAVGPLPHALALLAAASLVGAAGVRARNTAELLADRSPVREWLTRLTPVGPSGEPAGAGEDRVRLGAAPAARRLRIQVLGRFSMELDGAPLQMAGLRPLHRELLAVFAIFADRLVQCDQLVEWFWPGSEPARAQHSLQVAVSELRRLLGPGPDRTTVGLRREGSGYRLRLRDGVDCDVRELEDLVGRAQLAGRQSDTGTAIELLDAAVAAYPGDLIPEAGHPEWLLPERDRVRQLVAGAYEQLVVLRAASGQHRQAVAAARSGLIHDRHRDGLWRQLVNSLMELDEPVAAAAAQRGYAELLNGLDLPEPVRPSR